MKNTLITLIVVAIVVLGGWYLLSKENENQMPNTNGNGDQIQTQTYTNTEYGFALEYPIGWQVYETDNLYPAINITKSAVSSGNLPLIHHNNATQVSIFPDGVPTEGVFGETTPSSLSFEETTLNANDYLLEDGTRYGTFVNFSDPPASWGMAGFIWGQVELSNMQTTCTRDGEIVPQEQCDPLTGDNISISAEYSEEDLEAARMILESFQFTEPGALEDLIIVTSVEPGDTITSPLTLSGQARGQWLFEATAPVSLTDWDGRIIAEGYIEAEGEWMTTDFVPFSGTLTFTKPTNAPNNRGTLIFQKANASGLPEHDAALEIPVRFAQ